MSRSHPKSGKSSKIIIHPVKKFKAKFEIPSKTINSILLSRWDYTWLTVSLGVWSGENRISSKTEEFLRKYTLVDELPRKDKIGEKVEIKLNFFSTSKIIVLTSSFNIFVKDEVNLKNEPLICSLCVVFDQSVFPKIIENYDVITSHVQRLSKFYKTLHRRQKPVTGVGLGGLSSTKGNRRKNFPLSPRGESTNSSLPKDKRKRSLSVKKRKEKTLTEKESILKFNVRVQQFVSVFRALCQCGLSKFSIRDTVFFTNPDMIQYLKEKELVGIRNKILEHEKRIEQGGSTPLLKNGSGEKTIVDTKAKEKGKTDKSKPSKSPQSSPREEMSGKEDIEFCNQSSGKINKFLLTAVSSHLRTHGYTVIVGKNENEVKLWVNSLSLFLLPRERKRCKCPETGVSFVPELFVQGIILQNNQKFTDVVPIKDVLFGSFPVSIVDLTTRKVHAIKRYNFFVLIKKNVQYLYDIESDAKSILRSSHFEENRTSYPSVDKMLKTLYSIPSYLRVGYINQWIRLLHRKALTFTKLVNEYKNANEINIDEILKLTDCPKTDRHILLAASEKIQNGVYIKVFGNLTEEVETIIDFLENM